jgi:hypothetical protein
MLQVEFNRETSGIAGISSDFQREAAASLHTRLTGGEGGIRTPDTVSGMPVFKTGAINRSATSPPTTVLLQ